MEKCYLVVICLNNIHYIQLAKSDRGYSLSAFEEKSKAIEQFTGFKDKAMSSSYESHISGSMGIINLSPHIIEVPKDNPEFLRDYLIEDKLYELKGSVFGAFVNLAGVKVKEEILQLSVCDVAKEIINEVYSK